MLDWGREGLKQDRDPSGLNLIRTEGMFRGKRKSKCAFLRDGGSGKVLERNGEGGRSRKLRGLAGA